MKFQIFFFFGQYLIFCTKYKFVNLKAILGPNIRQANEFEFPFVVFITMVSDRYFDRTKPYHCIGSLISVRDVLCSEHCLENKTPPDLQVYVGSYNLRQCRRFYPLWWVGYGTWALHKNKIVTYPGNDLTVMKLTENVTDVQPATILMSMKETLYGSPVLLASWGKTFNENIPEKLEVAEVVVLSKQDCERRIREVHQKTGIIHDAIMCTIGNPHAVVTTGDEGCPVIFQNQVIGVTKGPYPTLPNEVFRADQINIHYTLGFYKSFILDILDNY